MLVSYYNFLVFIPSFTFCYLNACLINPYIFSLTGLSSLCALPYLNLFAFASKYLLNTQRVTECQRVCCTVGISMRETKTLTNHQQHACVWGVGARHPSGMSGTMFKQMQEPVGKQIGHGDRGGAGIGVRDIHRRKTARSKAQIIHSCWESFPPCLAVTVCASTIGSSSGW